MVVGGIDAPDRKKEPERRSELPVPLDPCWRGGTTIRTALTVSVFHSNLRGGLRETQRLLTQSAYWPFRVIQGG